MTGECKRLLCFGYRAWDNSFKRNQSIVKYLVDNEVFENCYYFNPSRYLSDLVLNPSKLTYFKIKNFKPLNRNIIVKNKFILPDRVRFFKCLGNWSLQELSSTSIISNDYCLLINRIDFHLENLFLALSKKAKLSIFDFSDDFLEFTPDLVLRRRITKFIENIIPSMDLVIYVNDHVKNKYSYLNKNSLVIRNATNYSNFNRDQYKKIPSLEKKKKGYEKIIGYIGTANSVRIDIDAIIHVLRSMPSWAYVFLGNVDQEIKNRLNNFENAYFYNFVHYTELPNYIRYFDVCTAPMLVNEHTRGNDLLKLHDYLAMGKPVVASEIGGATDLESIAIYRGTDDLLKVIVNEINTDNAHQSSVRKELAYKNSWQFRLIELKEILDNLL